MIDLFETETSIFFVSELAETDLYHYMANNKLSEKQVQKLCCQMLSALYYLHSNDVYQRNFHPKNILLNNSENFDKIEVKLSDYGITPKITTDTCAVTIYLVRFFPIKTNEL